MNEKVLEQLEEIARGMLYIETLEVRGADSLDFYDVSVWSIRAALEKAYLLGLERGVNNDRK